LQASGPLDAAIDDNEELDLLTGEVLARAAELKESGLSQLRVQRVLRREFPSLERHEAWHAAGLKLGRDAPLWYHLNPNLAREVRPRNDPRDAERLRQSEPAGCRSGRTGRS
jgi:hypothetical protein